MKRIAVFASGEGKASYALASLFNEGNRIKVILAVSDRENAGVLPAMNSLGVDAYYFPREKWTENPAEIAALLRDNDIDLLVLDGFGPLLPSPVFNEFVGRAVAIFPSLTPADSAGAVDILNVQKEVIAARESVAGAVVCKVEDIDGTGTIILQKHCDAGNDAVLLAKRIEDIQRDILPRAVVSFFNSSSSDGNAGPVNASSSLNLEKKEGVSDEIYIESDEEKKDSSLEEKWADALGVAYNLDEVKVIPPPVPPTATGVAPSNYNDQADMPPMPPSYLIWSVLCTIICCFVPGIVAIIYSSQVASKYYSHDYEGSKRSSEKAQIWIIVSFVLGLILSTIYLPLAFI